MKFLILTQSAKNRHYCVAGIDLEKNQLIRLVSDDVTTDYALTERHLIDSDGYRCNIFDIVNVNNTIHRPLVLQKENYYLPLQQKNIFCNGNLKYIQTLSNPYDFLMQSILIESKNNLFLGSYNYSLTEEEIKKLHGTSLFIYHVDILRLSKSNPETGNPKTKATLYIMNKIYSNISVTDYNYFDFHNDSLQDCLVVASLPNQPYKGRYFKFIAKIISKTR